jgi:predicted small metal-binding protein
MTFSLNCKGAGDTTCTHTISGETEQELFHNAMNHAIREHGMTAAEFEEDVKKNKEKYQCSIKKT